MTTGRCRPWFIGEAPSPSTSRYGGTPLVGESGRRLATWAGLSQAEFRRRAECRNLFQAIPQRWSRTDARLMAEAVAGAAFGAPEAPLLVLLGERVAEAFKLAGREPYREMQLLSGLRVATMPHPSGLNHHWNEEANIRAAEVFLHSLLGVPMPGPQMALPITA